MKDFLNQEIELGDILIDTKKKGRLWLLIFRGSYTKSGMIRVFEFFGLQDNRNNLKEGAIMLQASRHPNNVIKISKDKFKKLVDENLIQFVGENENEKVKDEILKLLNKIKNKKS